MTEPQTSPVSELLFFSSDEQRELIRARQGERAFHFCFGDFAREEARNANVTALMHTCTA